MLRPQFREEIKRWGYLILFLYLVLLAVSHLYIHDWSDRAGPPRDPNKKVVKLESGSLAYLEWGGANENLKPLILLHGSPASGANDFRKLGPELARSGRRVIAIDRWGYGGSERRVADYSFEADRKAVIGLMDKLGIAQAHVGGWSYGGAPAIILGDSDRERILSVSLIAAIGTQKGEGSGSYTVEHWKYGLLRFVVSWLPEALPHFGVLGSRSARRAFARDFVDSDQRKLASRLTTLETPLFIIHGKNDPLVSAWVAQEHHRLQPQSRLVILDGSHFFPFAYGDPENFEIASEEMNAFLAAAETGGASKLYGVRNETKREDLRALWDGGIPLRGYKPWGLVVVAGIAIGILTPRTGGLLAGIGAGLLLLDFVTAIAGVILGSIVKRGEDRTRFHKAITVLLSGVIGFVPAALLLPFF